MTAISPSAWLGSPALFRSVLRPERPAKNPGRHHGKHGNPWSPAIQVVGHMTATMFVFMSLVTLTWLASWGFSYLHSVHIFADDTYQLLESLESMLIRIDAALCASVALRGLWQYLIND